MTRSFRGRVDSEAAIIAEARLATGSPPELNRGTLLEVFAGLGDPKKQCRTHHVTARLAMTALKDLIITARVRLQVGRQRALDCTGHCDGYEGCRRKWSRASGQALKGAKCGRAKKRAQKKKEDEDGGWDVEVQVCIRNDGR